MVINKITKEVKPRVKTFFKGVETHFAFLKEHGYIAIGERLPSGYAVKDIVEFLYINHSSGRAIIIHFEPNNLEGDSINLISINLYKGARMINDNLLWDKQLVLSLYVEKYKHEFDILHLTYPDKNKEDSFEKNLNISLSGWAYFLKDIGINLVNGSEWEDGLFYDWSSAGKMLYDEQKRILENDERADGIE